METNTEFSANSFRCFFFFLLLRMCCCPLFASANFFALRFGWPNTGPGICTRRMKIKTSGNSPPERRKLVVAVRVDDTHRLRRRDGDQRCQALREPNVVALQLLLIVFLVGRNEVLVLLQRVVALLREVLEAEAQFVLVLRRHGRSVREPGKKN